MLAPRSWQRGDGRLPWHCFSRVDVRTAGLGFHLRQRLLCGFCSPPGGNKVNGIVGPRHSSPGGLTLPLLLQEESRDLITHDPHLTFPKHCSGARRRPALMAAFSGHQGPPGGWLWSCRCPEEDTALAAEVTQWLKGVPPGSTAVESPAHPCVGGVLQGAGCSGERHSGPIVSVSVLRAQS